MTDKNNTKNLIGTILESIETIKGEDIVVLDLQDIETAVTDFFIVCSANSNTQVAAIAGAIEKNARNNLKERPLHVEGKENAQWVLIDYVNVVVHIFQTETRAYYDIESLWNDAKTEKIENFIKN